MRYPARFVLILILMFLISVCLAFKASAHSDTNPSILISRDYLALRYVNITLLEEPISLVTYAGIDEAFIAVSSDDTSVIYVLNLSSLKKVWSAKLDHTVVGAEVLNEKERHYLVIARECREYSSYEVDVVMISKDSLRVMPVMMGKGKVVGMGRLDGFAIVGIRRAYSVGTDLYIISTAGYIVKHLHISDYGLGLVTDRQGKYVALATGTPNGVYRVFLTLANSLKLKECLRSENFYSLALASGESFVILLVADGEGLHVLNCSEGSCKEIVNSKVWNNGEVVKSIVPLSTNKYVVVTDRALYAIVLTNSTLKVVSTYAIAKLSGASFIPPDNFLAYSNVGVLHLFKVIAPCKLRIITQYLINVTIRSQIGAVSKVVTPTSSTVLYLRPGKYELIVKPVISGLYGVVGPTTHAKLKTCVVAESGGSKEITIMLSDFVRHVSIRNEWPVPIHLVLKWNGGEVGFTLPKHSAKSFLAFPGNYTVFFKPLTRFKLLAGPLRYFNRNVTVIQNTTLVLKPTEYLSYIKVVITGNIPANVTISWSEEKLKLDNVENSITLYAIPRVKYRVTASLAQTALSLARLTVRKYVSVSSPNEVKIVTIDFLKYGGVMRIASDCGVLVSVMPKNASLLISKVVIRGGESKSFLLPSGVYRVVVRPVGNYVKGILGNVSKLSSSYVCAVVPRGECVISYSLKEHLGTIVLASGSLSGDVSICWRGGNCREFKLRSNESLTIKAVTGKYLVTASTLVHRVPYLGEQKRITERYDILVKPMSRILVRTPQPAVLKIVSSSEYLACVKVRDEVSNSEVMVSLNSTIYLQPGVHRLLVTPVPKDFILGNATTTSKEITVYAMRGSTYEYVVNVKVAKLIPDLGNCIVNVTWNGGFARAVFEEGRIIKLTKCVTMSCKVIPLSGASLLLLPGRYLITTSPKILPIIGGREHVVRVRNLTVNGTGTYHVHVIRLATLKLIPNIPAGAIDYLIVKVVWKEGEYVTKAHGITSLTASPNVGYKVIVEPVLRVGMIGDPTVLRLVTYVSPMSEKSTTTLRYELGVAKVVVEGSGEVLVRYGTLTRSYHVEGVLSFNVVWRSKSVVNIILKPNIPSNFIGNPEGVIRKVKLTSENLSKKSVVLRIPKLSYLLIRGDSKVFIKFGQQVRQFVIKGFLKLAVAPGEYFVEVHPDLSNFRPLVGDVSSAYYTLRIGITGGRAAILSVDPKRVLSRVHFLCFKGSTLLIRWVNGEAKQICGEGEVYTYLVKGTYVIKLILPNNASLVPRASITRILVVNGGEDLLEDLRPAVVVLKSVSGSYSVKVISREGLYLRNINLPNGATLEYLVRPNATYLLKVSLAELPRGCLGNLDGGWRILNISNICKHLGAGSKCIIKLDSRDFVSTLLVKPNVNGIVQVLMGGKELVSKSCRAGKYLRFCLIAKDVIVRLIPSQDGLVGDVHALAATTHLHLEPGGNYLVELKALKPCTILLKNVVGDVKLEYRGHSVMLGTLITKSLEVKVVPSTRYVIKVYPYSKYLSNLTLTVHLNLSKCNVVIDVAKYERSVITQGEFHICVLVLMIALAVVTLSALYILRHTS